MNIRRFIEGEWEWIEASGAPPESRSTQGTYLFFSSQKDLLLDIAQREISSKRFFTARLFRTPHPRTGEYVLYLYGQDGGKEAELALRYGREHSIRYVGWKGDACTIGDFYKKMCINKEDLTI